MNVLQAEDYAAKKHQSFKRAAEEAVLLRGTKYQAVAWIDARLRYQDFRKAMAMAWALRSGQVRQ